MAERPALPDKPAWKRWIRHLWHQRCLWKQTGAPPNGFRPVWANGALWKGANPVVL